MKEKFLILFVGLVLGLSGYSQITSTASYFEATEYSDSDYVFVFCTDDINGGSLIADDSTAYGGYDFEWYKFNETTKDFTDVLIDFTINLDSTQSTISDLATGGYKVILTNVDTVQEYIAWVYNATDRTVDLEFDNANDCDDMAMWAMPNLSPSTLFDTPLNYYDLLSGESYILKNKNVLYEWSATPDFEFIKFNSPLSSMSVLPVEDITFSVIVTDRFGCLVSDEINYTAIETKADFRWISFDDKTFEELDNGNTESTLSGSAPLTVQFFNESENGAKYVWYFGDSTRNDDIDTIFTEDVLLEPSHTYYFTNDTGKTYTMKLYSESEFGCKDSISFNIKVLPTKIELPNVFTPNGDNNNDVFIIDNEHLEYQSIRSFKITIFNRVGQVVHEFDGDIRDWEGWDGTVKNSNRETPQGNYFFVVEVKGWDRKNYDNKNLSKLKDSSGDDTKSSMFGVIRLYR